MKFLQITLFVEAGVKLKRCTIQFQSKSKQNTRIRRHSSSKQQARWCDVTNGTKNRLLKFKIIRLRKEYYGLLRFLIGLILVKYQDFKTFYRLKSPGVK